MGFALAYQGKSVYLRGQLLTSAKKPISVRCIHQMWLLRSSRYLYELALYYLGNNVFSHKSKNKESIRRPSYEIDRFVKLLRVGHPNAFHYQLSFSSSPTSLCKPLFLQAHWTGDCTVQRPCPYMRDRERIYPCCRVKSRSVIGNNHRWAARLSDYFVLKEIEGNTRRSRLHCAYDWPPR